MRLLKLKRLQSENPAYGFLMADLESLRQNWHEIEDLKDSILFMARQFTSDPASCSTPFETIFRWDAHWTSIHVRPVTEQPDFIHYKVTLVDGSFVYLWKDPEAGWEEGMGDTDRARAIGQAIEISNF